jgi:protein-S-isoprenylcysteine O-methyltransferase Ste14
MGGAFLTRLTQIAASVFFLLLAITVASSVLPMVAGPQSALSVAALFAKLCVILFYTLLVWFTLTRAQPRAQAAGCQPRIMALLGTFLFVASLAWLKKHHGVGIAGHLISATLVATGSALMLAILLRLGRSFSIMAEARALVTSGPYAIVRHPLYVAEAIATIGVLIEFLSWAAATVVVLQFACQIQRMRNEEKVLLGAFPIDYARYMARTKRLIPGIW